MDGSRAAPALVRTVQMSDRTWREGGREGGREGRWVNEMDAIRIKKEGGGEGGRTSSSFLAELTL